MGGRARYMEPRSIGFITFFPILEYGYLLLLEFSESVIDIREQYTPVAPIGSPVDCKLAEHRLSGLSRNESTFRDDHRFFSYAATA